MSDYNLLKATSTDAQDVQNLLALAGAGLAQQGFHNWSPPFSLEQVSAEITSRDVFLVFSSSKLVASYSIGATAVRAYPASFWPSGELGALYMNRLAVDPAMQGRGIGNWCLSAIREESLTRNITAIRCDVLYDNLPLRRFYEKNGYGLHGEREHSGWKFACYQSEHVTQSGAG